MLLSEMHGVGSVNLLTHLKIGRFLCIYKSDGLD